MKQEKPIIAIDPVLNRIAAQLPLLEKTDMQPLMGVMNDLESVQTLGGLQPAFKTLISRTIALIKNIIMQDVAFDAGCKKLGESISKMRKEAEKKSGQTGGRSREKDAETEHDEAAVQEPSRADTADKNSEIENQIPDDLRDLVVKFASNQQAVLEDFESYILEHEKGISQAKGAIKRVLHTWKGEFGVLDMQEYAKLVHDIEDRFESDAISGEHLFKLKDFLADRMPR